MDKEQEENKKTICPECKEPMSEMPASRDYTEKCSKCFAKGFVASIFKKH